MAAAYQSSSNSAEHSTANTVFNSSGELGVIADGSLLLLWQFLFNTAALPTPTQPTGFLAAPGTWPLTYTQASNRFAQYLFYKIASGESGSYTDTHTAVVAARGCMVCVNGNDTSSPFDVTPTQNQNTNTATTTFDGLTPANANDLILLLASDDNDNTNTLTPPTGPPTFTGEIVASGGTFLAQGSQATTSAIANQTMTNNSATGVGAFSFFASMIAVRSAAGGGGTPPIPATVLSQAVNRAATY